MTIVRTTTRVLAPALVLSSAALLGSAVPALAQGGHAVVRSGACQGAAHWKLKAGADDGRIEVEGEVDSSHRGQTWRWSLTHNGAAAGHGTRTTAGRSGSFEVRRVTGNAAGADVFVFTARRAGTQQVCRGTVRF